MRFYLLFPLLLCLSCGGRPGAPGTTAGSDPPPLSGPAGVRLPAPAAPEPELPNEVPMTDVTPDGELPDGEVNGPFEPPVIPETVYAPYLRRSVTPAPALPTPDNHCTQTAEVRNYDGVDGCGLMLETDEGNLFVVGADTRGDPLEAGTRISFGFEYMTDFADNSCGNADAIIRITCRRLLRVSSGLPRPVVCESYDTPSKWLVDLATGLGATYITRFPWADDRFVYLLETADGQYLYDCRGYLICRPRRNCLSYIDDFSQGQLIYER